jgi:hypothetical protein
MISNSILCKCSLLCQSDFAEEMEADPLSTCRRLSGGEETEEMGVMSVMMAHAPLK